MKLIPAFETSDKTRFFAETEARDHERRFDFSNHIDLAVKGNPQFARLDRDLLLEFLIKHGSTIGKLADAPIVVSPSGNPINRAALDTLARRAGETDRSPTPLTDEHRDAARQMAQTNWPDDLPKTKSKVSVHDDFSKTKSKVSVHDDFSVSDVGRIAQRAVEDSVKPGSL